MIFVKTDDLLKKEMGSLKLININYALAMKIQEGKRLKINKKKTNCAKYGI